MLVRRLWVATAVVLMVTVGTIAYAVAGQGQAPHSDPLPLIEATEAYASLSDKLSDTEPIVIEHSHEGVNYAVVCLELLPSIPTVICGDLHQRFYSGLAVFMVDMDAQQVVWVQTFTPLDQSPDTGEWLVCNVLTGKEYVATKQQMGARP